MTDSTFRFGTLMLPTEPSTDFGYPLENLTKPEGLEILVIISLILFIWTLPKLRNLIHSLLGCLLRWKELVNIESSAKLVRYRDSISKAYILPFLLIIINYDIYSPSYFQGFAFFYKFLIISGITLIYLTIRELSSAFKPYNINNQIRQVSKKSIRSFFIFSAILIALTAGLLTPFDVPTQTIKSILIWELLGVYFLFLIRKTQVFIHNCGYFPAFLYLCTLEIGPTVLLVSSAVLI